MNNKEWIKPVYLTAGLVNVIGIPVFSKFFTNEYLSSIDSAAFSGVGLGVIVIWGMAYIAVAHDYQKVPFLSFVFGIEKIFYGTFWILWMKNNYSKIPVIFSTDVITGLFYSVYGINDLLFGLFFFYVYFYVRTSDSNVTG